MSDIIRPKNIHLTSNYEFSFGDKGQIRVSGYMLELSSIDPLKAFLPSETSTHESNLGFRLHGSGEFYTFRNNGNEIGVVNVPKDQSTIYLTLIDVGYTIPVQDGLEKKLVLAYALDGYRGIRPIKLYHRSNIGIDQLALVDNEGIKVIRTPLDADHSRYVGDVLKKIRDATNQYERDCI